MLYIYMVTFTINIPPISPNVSIYSIHGSYGYGVHLNVATLMENMTNYQPLDLGVLQVPYQTKLIYRCHVWV